MIPKHNQNGWRAQWEGREQDILENIVHLAIQTRVKKLKQRQAGERIVRRYPARLRDAGWWSVGLAYNRVVRHLHVEGGPRGGRGPNEPRSIDHAIQRVLSKIASGWDHGHKE